MKWKQISAVKHETATPDNQQVTDESPYNIQMLAREQNLNYTISFSGFFLFFYQTKCSEMISSSQYVHSTIYWPVALHDEAYKSLE